MVTEEVPEKLLRAGEPAFACETMRDLLAEWDRRLAESAQ